MKLDSWILKSNFLLILEVFLIQSWTHSLGLFVIIFVIIKTPWIYIDSTSWSLLLHIIDLEGVGCICIIYCKMLHCYLKESPLRPHHMPWLSFGVMTPISNSSTNNSSNQLMVSYISFYLYIFKILKSFLKPLASQINTTTGICLLGIREALLQQIKHFQKLMMHQRAILPYMLQRKWSGLWSLWHTSTSLPSKTYWDKPRKSLDILLIYLDC